jgi:hypothetical protein
VCFTSSFLSISCNLSSYFSLIKCLVGNSPTTKKKYDHELVLQLSLAESLSSLSLVTISTSTIVIIYYYLFFYDSGWVLFPTYPTCLGLNAFIFVVCCNSVSSTRSLSPQLRSISSS